MKILIDIPSNYKERIDTDFENLDTGSIGCTACMFAIKEGLSFPDGATNGDIIKAMFPSMETFRSSDVVEIRYKVHDEVWCVSALDNVWWDEPYKRGEEDADSN